MKKTILLACGLLAAVAVHAQDKKMWLGGTASIQSQSYKPGDDKQSSMTFGPQFGYWLNENLAFGISLGLSSTKSTEVTTEEVGIDTDGDGIDDLFTDVTSSEDVTNSSISFSPFVRYYKSLGDNIQLYGELGINVGSTTAKTDVPDPAEDPDPIKGGFFGIGIGPGIQYWFHDSWSVNAHWGALSYRSDTIKKGGFEDGKVVDAKTNTFDLNLDLSRVSFGLNFHF